VSWRPTITLIYNHFDEIEFRNYFFIKFNPLINFSEPNMKPFDALLFSIQLLLIFNFRLNGVNIKLIWLQNVKKKNYKINLILHKCSSIPLKESKRAQCIPMGVWLGEHGAHRWLWSVLYRFPIAKVRCCNLSYFAFANSRKPVNVVVVVDVLSI
jgi:hypothetical protein